MNKPTLREKIRAIFYRYGGGLLSIDDATDQILNLLSEELDKLTVISGVRIGDNLDLEIEAEYPCSDYSSVMTVSVDKLLKAQLEHTISQLKELLG